MDGADAEAVAQLETDAADELAAPAAELAAPLAPALPPPALAQMEPVIWRTSVDHVSCPLRRCVHLDDTY